MSLITQYNSKENLFYIESGISWHVGTQNTVQTGIRRLLTYLDENGYILIEGPEIFDYEDTWGGDICYVLLAKALPKLDYLEWCYRKNRKKK